MNRLLVYLGIGLVAMVTLMLEILLTRITSVIAWYHLAFFVISLAMLGMTAGSVWVFLRAPRDDPNAAMRDMTKSSMALAVTLLPCFTVSLGIPLAPISSWGSFAALLAYGVALAIPFAAAGVVLTLALTRAGLPAQIAYGVDLCGAALGCVLVIPLLDLVDAPSAVLLTGSLAGIASLCFSLATRTPTRSSWIAVAVLILMGVANANLDPSPLRPQWVKGEREDIALYDYVSWNTFSRVTVEKPATIPPAFWSAGRHIPTELQAPTLQRAITIDGAAETVMLHHGADLDAHAFLDWDVSNFVHHLRPRGPVAIVGVGGGRDVVAALRAGHETVVGIEINDLIVDLHHGALAQFSGIGELANVRLIADEARSFLERDTEKYSVIVMSLIDTWAATGAGAYSLSENGLYTVEGWNVFLDSLQPEGVLSVTRWFKSHSPGETTRMLALSMEVLWLRGANNPRDHLILLQHEGVATLLVSPSPFSSADIDHMQNEAVRLGVNMLLTPRKLPISETLKQLAVQPDRRSMWSWAESQKLDFRPPTDNRPFFFNMLKPQTWLFGMESPEDLDWFFLGNLQATHTLIYGIVIGLLLTVVSVVVPLWRHRGAIAHVPRSTLWLGCAYFTLIGFGFMFVEIGLLSRLGVYLGHPILALAVLLGGLILFTGLGSMLSGYVPVERPWVAMTYPLIVAVLVALVASMLDTIFSATAAADMGGRILVSIAVLAPPALGLGLGFPLGLRLVEAREGRAVTPWLWGINGAAGVCSSGIALGVSMAWGVSTTLTLGALAYAAISVCSTTLSRRSTT